MESSNPKNRVERGASAMLGRTDPGTNETQNRMSERTFHCYGCGTEWNTRTTLKPHTTDGKIHLDICSSCHPFFTGKQKLVDTAGRVEKFKRRSFPERSVHQTDDLGGLFLGDAVEVRLMVSGKLGPGQ